MIFLCVTIQVKVITQYLHNGLFAVWKINIEVKESTEDACLVSYHTCATGYYHVMKKKL